MSQRTALPDSLTFRQQCCSLLLLARQLQWRHSCALLAVCAVSCCCCKCCLEFLLLLQCLSRLDEDVAGRQQPSKLEAT